MLHVPEAWKSAIAGDEEANLGVRTSNPARDCLEFSLFHDVG